MSEASRSEFSEHPDDDDVEGAPLTDEELRQAEYEQWAPASTDYYDMTMGDVVHGAAAPRVPSLLPSEFTQYAFRMPTQSGWENFSFEGRNHLQQIYDTPHKRVLLICARQVEKCQNLTCAVTLANGRVVQAKDIRVGQEVACLDMGGSATRMTSSKVTWVSKHLTKPGVLIKTRQGHELELAETHPVRVWGSWRKAKDIQVGDRVAAVRRAGVFGTVRKDDARVELLGYMVANGGTTQAAFTYSGGTPVSTARFLAVVAGIGGTVGVMSEEHQQYRLHKTTGKRIYDWLETDGAVGKYSYEKELPDWVFDLTRRQASLLLNRLWACGGSCKQDNPSKYSLEYCTTSKLLSRQVQSLLWKFGIPTSIRENQTSYVTTGGDPARLAYILRVETQDGVRAFLTEVGALGKSEDIELPTAEENNNRDTYPMEINELLSAIVESRRVALGGVHVRPSLRSAGLRETLEYPPTRGKLQRYVDFFESTNGFDQALVAQLKEHLATDLYWDEVESVTALGQIACVDFEVAKHHNFLVDGVVTHNSTLLGNRALSLCCLIPSYKVLYVSPSMTQTKTFSNDRVKDPIDTSPILKSFTTTMLSQNVLEKQFVNRSKITLRYAYLNADRTRGIPAHSLLVDEIQDIISDNIPVIEQCTSHAPAELKSFTYSGTPKTLDNVIEDYWSNRSTQNQWAIPCTCKGGDGGRYWNILGEKNIGKKNLICEGCGKQIYPMVEGAQWAATTAWDPKHAPFEGFRIPKLMVPWLDWPGLLYDFQHYPRNKFYNEVLGMSFDTGLRPLTTAEVKANCNPNVRMVDVEKYQRISAAQDVFAGIDWGCHDDQTRILTESGFKYFKDLTPADKVAQWDPDTRGMTFTLPKALTVRDWDQPLLHMKTKGGIDLMVTHTHRMRVGNQAGEKWVTESAGETAKRGGNVKFVGVVNWDGVRQEEFTLPGLPTSPGYPGSEARVFKMADWLEFLGYLVTEGGVCHDNSVKGKGRPSCIKMSQRTPVNQETYEKIKACMERMAIPFSTFPNEETGDVNWTICGKQYWKWCVENIGDACHMKRLPRAVLALPPDQLWILFRAMVAGDGYTDPREGTTGGAFYSTSKGLCEDFQEVCIRLGLRSVLRLHKPAEGNRRTRWLVLWSLATDYCLNTPAKSVEHVPYSGKVYCCAVPTGYIVTERNGCISYQGNTGENSYTVLTLGTYIGNKFRVFYFHRFTGEDTEPDRQLEKLESILRAFNVRVIGTDYGGGHYPNDFLVRRFGKERVMKYQYAGRLNAKVRWEPKLGRYIAHRTEVMSAVFNALKRGNVFELPAWLEMKDLYAQDMLNIFSEYNEKIRMIQYGHTAGKTDDSLHSMLYCFLASMHVRPRPDIIAPNKETKGQGPVHGGYSGSTDQG